MDLHRLEIFVKVAELKSFTLAAEELRLSQPTVSEHIRSLEEMVEATLVDRLGRELRLTAAGQLLHRYAVKLLQMREEALQAMADFRGVQAGRVVIGASTIPGSYLLPQVMGAFKGRHPSVQITLKIANTAAVAEMVQKGEAGLGLVGSRLPEKRLSFEEVYLDELVLAVPPQHPWAARAEVAPADLYGQPFIMRERGSGTQMAVRRILGEHGLEVSRLTVAAEMPNTEAVRQSIKAGVGIGILSRLAVAAELAYGDLVAVTIKGIAMARPLFLIQRPGRDLPVVYEAFGDFVRQMQKAGNREKGTG